MIETEHTPNPDTLKFLPGKKVSEVGPVQILKDDKSIKNPLATDITKYEREFRVSPYHGSGDNKIWIRVDNSYTITSYDSDNNPTTVGSSVGVSGAYLESYSHDLPDNLVRLEIQTNNSTEGAGFIAKIDQKYFS